MASSANSGDTTTSDMSNGGTGKRNNPLGSRKKDLFLFFSNQERRINYLMGRDERPEQNAFVSENPQDGTERQTRLSFELHSSLIMEDVLLHVTRGEDGNRESSSISAITAAREAATPNSSTAPLNNPQAILLRQLLMMDLSDPADEAGGTPSDIARQTGEE